MTERAFWSLTRRLASYAVLCAVTFLVCFPLVWALSTSLKPKSEIFATPPTLIPKTVTLENYHALITGRPQYFQSGGQQVTSGTTPAQFFTRWFMNSLIVTIGSPSSASSSPPSPPTASPASATGAAPRSPTSVSSGTWCRRSSSSFRCSS